MARIPEVSSASLTSSTCVSNGRAINAVTGPNWEGTGVSPDYQVKAEAALTAHKQMLKELIDQGDDDMARQDREMHLQQLEAQ